MPIPPPAKKAKRNTPSKTRPKVGKKRAYVDSKKGTKSTTVTGAGVAQSTSTAKKHPLTDLNALIALGRKRPASEEYAAAFIKFVLTHDTRISTVSKLNRNNTKLATPSFIALKPVETWGSAHINYLAWAARFLCPRCKISEDMQFNRSKGAIVKLLRVLKNEHDHYQALTTIYLRIRLELVGAKGKLPWREEWAPLWKRVRTSVKDKTEDKEVLMPPVLRTHYSQESWGVDCFRYLLFEDGLEITNGDYFKRKRLFDRLKSANAAKNPSEFNAILSDLLETDKYDIEYFAKSHEPCTKKRFSLPRSASFTYPESGVTKASLLLWIRGYRESFKDLRFKCVNPHTIYEAFTLISDPTENQLIYKQLFTILCAKHENDNTLNKSLSSKEHRSRIVDFLGDWRHLRAYPANRKMLEPVEFADGRIINGKFEPGQEEETSSVSEEAMEVDMHPGCQ